MSINTRIKEIVDYYYGRERGSFQKFADKLNVSRQAVTNLCTEGSSVGMTSVMKILDAFDLIDANWLLREKGNMLRVVTSNDASAVSDEKVKDVAYWKHVALSMSEEVTEKKDRIKELERELQRLGDELDQRLLKEEREGGASGKGFQDCLGKRHRSCCITCERSHHIGSFSCYNKTIHHVSLMKQKNKVHCSGS